MIMLRRALVCVYVCIIQFVPANEIHSLRDLEKAATLDITDAKVAKARDAERIAFKTYAQKMNLAVSAYETAAARSIVTLGFTLDGFAAVGDKVWEVRMFIMTSDSTRALRGLLWINPRTEAVRFISGAWEKGQATRGTAMVAPSAQTAMTSTGVSTHPLRIDNTRVINEADAKRIAFDAYAKRIDTKRLHTESVRKITAIPLGYDVPGFADKADLIWESRVMTAEGALRALIWVNSRTKCVRYLCGAWEEKTTK